MLNGTAYSVIRGLAFSFLPVAADPVKVTTSRSSTKSKMFLADPQTS